MKALARRRKEENQMEAIIDRKNELNMMQDIEASSAAWKEAKENCCKEVVGGCCT